MKEESNKYAISTEKLTKYYGPSIGMKNVSLNVEKGELYGFIGPNGAGKSTFIRTVLGLLQPTSGKAKLFGEDACSKGAEVRQLVGYLPSEVNYYDEMNARELLEYSASFYKKKAGNIDELSDYFELDLTKRITDLSFGNKKKVSIIQSLLHEPELLILDEPTYGLDPFMQNRFFEKMEDLHEKGVTIFFSSHILSDVQRLCNKAAIIKDGEIIKEENIKDLMKKQMKKCYVVFDQKPDNKKLPENAQKENWVDNKLSFEYMGEIKPLMKWLSEQKIMDVRIEEPTLENIFMNYYER